MIIYIYYCNFSTTTLIATAAYLDRLLRDIMEKGEASEDDGNLMIKLLAKADAEWEACLDKCNFTVVHFAMSLAQIYSHLKSRMEEEMEELEDMDEVTVVIMAHGGIKRYRLPPLFYFPFGALLDITFYEPWGSCSRTRCDVCHC